MNALTLNSVSKSFEGIHAVNNISIGFEAGKITALIGPNGAGKTTIFNLISGFQRPDKGSINYRDKDIQGIAPWKISQRGIGRLFQDIRLFEQMTVKDNILTAFKNQKGESALLSIVTRWKINKDDQNLTANTIELLSKVKFDNKADELSGNLSYGEQKILAIIRLIAANADLLLLDEPTAGINTEMIKIVLALIRELENQGKTIIIIEHNMNVIKNIAKSAYFIDEGLIVDSGPTEKVLANPIVRSIYLGL